MVGRDCLQSSPTKHLPLTTVKRLQWKIDDTVERSTCQWKKRKVIIKQKYSIINFSNVLLILCVKYFYSRLRFKVVIDKVVGGHFFPDTVYIRAAFKS